MKYKVNLFIHKCFPALRCWIFPNIKNYTFVHTNYYEQNNKKITPASFNLFVQVNYI